jgi:putative metallohydrolase (TIGR04338 family)
MVVQRDTQRAKVYDAEHLVHRIFDRSDRFPTVDVAGSRLTLPVERRFASADSVQDYVDRVLALSWVRTQWPRAAVPVRVRERAGHTQAHYERDPAVIALPGHRANAAWALRELVVLHELAHHLSDCATDGGEPQHGGGFVDRLLTLVDGIIGPEAALLLRVTMLESGVAVG